MSESRVVDTDKGWRALFDAVKTMRGEQYVKVGVLGDSSLGGMHKTEPDGKASPLTTAEIAAVNEYGTKDGRIPARPAFRGTFDRLREPLLGDFAKLLVEALRGELSTEAIFDVLGMKLAAEIRKTITTGTGVPPPNAPSTLREKLAHGTTKSAKALGATARTLVDTGAEIAAISWALVRGGKQGEATYLAKGGK